MNKNRIFIERTDGIGVITKEQAIDIGLSGPNLRRIYMHEDFEYYPLRKDFPLQGIPGSIPLPGQEKVKIQRS